jgi:hypothetical protein
MKSNLKSSPPNSIIYVVLDQLSLMQRPVSRKFMVNKGTNEVYITVTTKFYYSTQLSLIQRPVHVRYTITSACSDLHFVANKYYALVSTHSDTCSHCCFITVH